MRINITPTMFILTFDQKGKTIHGSQIYINMLKWLKLSKYPGNYKSEQHIQNRRIEEKPYISHIALYRASHGSSAQL